jgi:hypothetical protein
VVRGRIGPLRGEGRPRPRQRRVLERRLDPSGPNSAPGPLPRAPPRS